MQKIGKWRITPCSLRIPNVVASNLEALAMQLSRNGLEEIWSPFIIRPYLEPCAGRTAADNLWAPPPTFFYRPAAPPPPKCWGAPPPFLVEGRPPAADILSARRRYHFCCVVIFGNFR